MTSLASHASSWNGRKRSTTRTVMQPLLFRCALPLVAAALLGACASTAPGGRSQLSAPEPISALYSSLDLKLTLAALAPVTDSCAGIQCQVDKGFERQVARLGVRLAETAYASYPDLKQRIPGFSFVVAEKIEGGSSSNASGTIVIYRGVRKAPLEEETLAWLIAREMGRVIARHHDEKSAATIISSLLAQVLLGPANLARGLAFVASSTATVVGQEMITAGSTPERAREADMIALDLLFRQGWSDTEIADSLLDYSNRLGNDPWANDVRRATRRLAGYTSGEVLAMVQSPFR
ncbi:MAG: hypothetical protein NTY05_08115 [Rhodocyclales bacterium]|nr:hypothetical protein [Rhodocyclales bacterium]